MIRRAWRSLFARLLGGTVLAVVLALTVVALALPRMAESFLLLAKERDLAARGRQASSVAAAYLEGVLSEAEAQTFLRALGASGDTEAWIIDRQGMIVLDSSPEGAPIPGLDPGPGIVGFRPGMGLGMGLGHGQHWGWRVRGFRLLGPDAAQVLSGEEWSATGTRWPYDDPVVSVAVPARSTAGGSDVLGAVFLNSPVSGIAETAAALQKYLLYAAGVGLVAAFGMAVVTSRNVTRPVREMSLMAGRIARGDLDVRAPLGGPAEIAELGRSLNTMAGSLAASREEGRRLETMRRDLVANVSHDLRSPITAIRGYVEPLLDGTVEDEATRRRYLETVRAETDALGLLVADIMELTRLEAGPASLKLDRVDIGQLARETAARYAVRAEEAGIGLEVEVAPDLPPLVADEGRVTRAIQNLLDNAIKFTPCGGKVTLGVRPGEGEVVIAVRDTGIGISPADLPLVWERFYKADRSRHRAPAVSRAGGDEASRAVTRTTEGSGLGLAIIKEIAEAHGGRVEVESEPGRGAEFRLHLPAGHSSPSAGGGA